MSAKPLVSVIIPARNEERYIARALASVVRQTWALAEIEVIVVDNGSSDATAATVRAFMESEPRLCIRLLHEPVAGVARAKNRGARAATGFWLLFLDADSRLAPDLIERVVRRGQEKRQAASIRIVADGQDLLDRAFFALLELGPRWFGLRAQMFYCGRELFWRVGGFDETLLLAEDSDFLARLRRNGVAVDHLLESWIATSPRRMHRGPWRLGMLKMFARWALANWGIGRRWRY
ncbi:MAG TPA: glycosyltransferase [Chloroflexota bacterium]|nr:glycosyltransferase [Chloroflexota bacterium]